MHAQGLQTRRRITCIPTEKFRVFDPVFRSVPARILHRFGYDLRTVQPADPSRHGKPDEPCAAVEVKHGFLSRQPREFCCFSVKTLRHIAVDLVKRLWRKPHADAAKRIRDIRCTPKHGAVCAEDDIGALGIAVELYARNTGMQL